MNLHLLSCARGKHLPVVILMSIVLSISLSAQESCDSLAALGDTSYAQYKNVQALNYYEKAYEKCPNHYETLFRVARTLNDVGEDKSDPSYYRKAIEKADILISNFPDSLQGYFLKAAASGNLALSAEATEKVKISRNVHSNIKKALDINPDYAPAHVILGSYYREVASANSTLKFLANTFLGGIPEGSMDDALSHLKKALSLEPQNIYAHLEIAKVYKSIGKEDLARSHLKKIQSIPNSNHFHAHLK